ncbi:SGNH/GDSL hydrolase family protein [Pannus brasiliensis CCIBt3594]|uniref:SGNH/GDSL hydrolase family protein n=1 Tax=Pannus brasiliensis CCIBt3594 TaxID=1427578 RepID=A0AAW9QY37_9CHRO
MLLEIGIVRLSAIILGVILVAIAILEAILRFAFGLGNPLLYQTDAEIGYLLAPNQKTRRSGNYIEINQYSMRSAPIAAIPPANTTRILLLGDSIANGAWWTDQSRTISALVGEGLSRSISPPVEVLNASANSWGPRNQLAYLERFGTFGARVLVLLMNTDDLFATAPSSAVVGRDINYPDRSPGFAIIELYDKYFKRYPPVPKVKEEGDRLAINLAAVEKIQAIARENQATFILAITPLIRESRKEGKDYEIKARRKLAEFARDRSIPYVDFLPVFQGVTPPDSLYRDNIHLSPAGNALVSQKLADVVREVLER